MRRSSLIAAAYSLDWLLGDPQWLPHPVRIVGWSTARGELVLRRLGSGRNFDLAAGAALAVGVPTAFALAAHLLLRSAKVGSRAFAAAAEIWFASTCLATRNLLDEARQVLHALHQENLPAARLRLSRIVGRDTESLDESEICRALIETLAESLNDGIIAPLFYLTIGGVPVAMAYKAINTLDSMIGHRDERYLWFGCAAARLDDLAGLIPSRISALLICLVAMATHANAGSRSARIWFRDGLHHASPNAGQPESAMAGALGVRLGGSNTYGGETIRSQHLGREFPPPSPKKASQALRFTAAASLLGFAAFFLWKVSRSDA